MEENFHRKKLIADMQSAFFVISSFVLGELSNATATFDNFAYGRFRIIGYLPVIRQFGPVRPRFADHTLLHQLPATQIQAYAGYECGLFRC